MHLDLDGYKIMWDPEYSDSELRAVEASGQSRDELYTSTPADSTETQSQADGWYAYMCDQCPSDVRDKKCCCDYP